MARPRHWELDALDPYDESTIKRGYIDQGTVEFLTRGTLSARFYRLQCVKDVLQEPEAIFAGWNRDGYDDGICYVGRPRDHPKEGIEIPPPPGRCFFVFMLPSGKIEEWRWEEFSLANDEDYRKQFGEHWRKIWPPTGTK